MHSLCPEMHPSPVGSRPAPRPTRGVRRDDARAAVDRVSKQRFRVPLLRMTMRDFADYLALITLGPRPADYDEGDSYRELAKRDRLLAMSMITRSSSCVWWIGCAS